MNPRLPHAGRVLCDEISEIDEDATFEAGDMDGLGVYRTVAIFAGNLTRLADALVRLSQIDRRIESVGDTDDYLIVHFPPDQIVWSRARFGLKDLYDALADAEPQSRVKPEDEEKPKPRKRAAKKTPKND